MKNSVILTFTFLLICSGFTPAHAQTRYTFKDISAEIGQSFTVTGMNASGAIIGTGHFQSPSQPVAYPHGFMFDGFMHDLGTFSDAAVSARSEANAINNSGKVVGRSEGLKGGMRAVLFDGGAHDLGSPGDSGAYAINAAGHVTGYLFVSFTDPGSLSPVSTQRAFLYDGKTMKDLALVVGNNSIGVGIDDNDRILIKTANGPYRALIYEGGKANDIGDLGGGTTMPVAMNAGGQAIGTSRTKDRTGHAFMYDGVLHDLGVLPDKVGSDAKAINAQGTIVGSSMAGRGRPGGDRAFVYEGSKMTDLNDLLVGDHTDLVFSDALAINDKGVILAMSNKRAYYLLTPANDAEVKTDEARIAAIPPPQKKVIPNGEISGSGAKIDRSGKTVTLSFTDLYGNPQTYTVERPGFAAAMLEGKDDGGWAHLAEDGKSGTMFNVGASGSVSGSPVNPMMLRMMAQQK